MKPLEHLNYLSDMKKIFLSVVALMSMATVSSAKDTLGEALQNGKYSTNTRVFYFNRGFEEPSTADNAIALTAGGIMKYVSDDIKAQYGGNSYANGDNSTLFGIKSGTSIGMFDLALLYDKISDNSFKVVEARVG